MNTVMTDQVRAGTGQAGQDALSILADDHRQVEAAFAQFEQMRGGAAADRSGLSERICMKLRVHSKLEEEYFYPALRQAGSGLQQVDEALREHAQVDQLIDRIADMDADDAQFDAQMGELKTMVEQHVQEEESDLFDAARGSGINLQDLGQRMAERKTELMAAQSDTD